MARFTSEQIQRHINTVLIQSGIGDFAARTASIAGAEYYTAVSSRTVEESIEVAKRHAKAAKRIKGKPVKTAFRRRK